MILFLLSLILVYVYAFVSGFTDAANAIATVIGSRSLSPRQAVLMAGVLEIVGALTGTAVALTIGRDIINLENLSLVVVVGALLAAMSWSLITYYFGLPVSETHGLVGGLVGAGIVVAGLKVVIWGTIFKILLAILLSPLLGWLGGIVLMKIVIYFCSSLNSRRMEFVFKQLQRVSAAVMALSHGRNDAQKPMGILMMILALQFGWKDLSVPYWVILSVGLTAGLGVAYGGEKIIKTLGFKVAKISSAQGFAAETSASLALQLASMIGIPVSTTHTISSAIVGSGMAQRRSNIKWELFGEIVISWIFTLPATITLGLIFTYLLSII